MLGGDQVTYEEEIGVLRKSNDRLNEEIIEKLAEWVELAVRMGAVKRRHGRPDVDRRLEEEVYDQIRRLARGRRLDAEGVERIFREIVRLCAEAGREPHP